MDKNFILDNFSKLLDIGIGALLWYINTRFGAIKDRIDEVDKKVNTLTDDFKDCQREGADRGEDISRIQGRLNSKFDGRKHG